MMRIFQIPRGQAPRLAMMLLVAWLLLAAHAIAANVRWTGNAQDVAQVSTIQSTGTWATGDTATVICNKKSVTVTLGTAVTNDDVAEALAAAINAGDATSGLVGDETRNAGGQSIDEFTEIVASASGDVLTLRSALPGVPFTVTRTEATAGSGALGAVTPVTAATGKHWLSNADNYEGGALPADNDVLYIDAGGVSILYGLDYFRTNTIDLHVIVTTDFTGSIGRPLLTATGYQDYRTPRYFQFQGDNKDLEFLPGTTGVTPQGTVFIDLQDQEGVDVIVKTTRGSGTAPSIFVAGADATTFSNRLTLTAGAVSIEPDDAATASNKFAAFSDVVVGVPLGDPTAATLVIGRNARLHKALSIDQHSGVVTTHAATENGADQAATTIFGGTFNTLSGGDNFTFTVHAGGSLVLQGAATFDVIYLRGGTLDLRQATSQQTLPSIKAVSGSAIYDPNARGVAGFNAVGCTLSQLTLQLPTNRAYDLSADATP